MRIGVCGFGMVGGALYRWLAHQKYDVSVFNPAKGYTEIEALDRDIVFVCVPTPTDSSGQQDESYLHEALSTIPRPTLVVIRSTVLPGTTRRLASQYTHHRFLFNPEFLEELHADRDMFDPARQIVGCLEETAAEAEKLLAFLPVGRHYNGVVRVEEAEMAKYFSNAFYALKITFANQMYDLCERLGVSYDEVRKLATADPKIAPKDPQCSAYLHVPYDGHRGFTGNCLPKDVLALIEFARQNDIKLRLLEEADYYNAALALLQG
jgi:UDPglucose 6-dehydrogenase